MYQKIKSAHWTTWCKHTSIYHNKLSSLTAGVGNALEGGRGRAGTKLFQDFQILSRIWTHPWCLQLDYISKENRVGLLTERWNYTKQQLKNWEYIHTNRTHCWKTTVVWTGLPLCENNMYYHCKSFPSFLLTWSQAEQRLADLCHHAFKTYVFPLVQGFFDEDSMDEFIASETEESSMSLTSEDERSKK